jgi:hypothetical protein
VRHDRVGERLFLEKREEPGQPLAQSIRLLVDVPARFDAGDVFRKPSRHRVRELRRDGRAGDARVFQLVEDRKVLPSLLEQRDALRHASKNGLGRVAHSPAVRIGPEEEDRFVQASELRWRESFPVGDLREDPDQATHAFTST